MYFKWATCIIYELYLNKAVFFFKGTYLKWVLNLMSVNLQTRPNCPVQ
jgi:hypothetical protein